MNFLFNAMNNDMYAILLYLLLNESFFNAMNNEMYAI